MTRFSAIIVALLCATAAHANRLLDIENAAFTSFSTFQPAAVVDPTSNVLPSANDSYANWVNAGMAVQGGIPNRTTQCGATVTPSGLVPPQAGDDYSKINAAISACTAGQVVLLGSGTFNIDMGTELPIYIQKGITLRGTGNCTNGSIPWCSTILQVYNGPQPTYTNPVQCGVTISPTTNCPNTNPLILVTPEPVFANGWAGCQSAATNKNPTTQPCGTTLTADAAQGDRTISVSSTIGFTVGGWMMMDETPSLTSQTNPVTGQAAVLATPDWLTNSNQPVDLRMANVDVCQSTPPFCPYSFAVNRVNQDMHLITAIGAGTLTFDDPVTMAFHTGQDARAYWPTAFNSTTYVPLVTGASVENMTVRRAPGGAITFYQAAYSWVTNVESYGWVQGGVNTEYSARIAITHNYLHDCYDCQNNGAEYPVGISTGSTEVLVDDNILNFGGKGLVGRSANTAVIAYNYIDDTFYETIPNQIGNYWNDMGINGSHYGGTHHFLMEGNWGPNCDDDETHGSTGGYHTHFRNWCRGYRTPFTDPSDGFAEDDLNGLGQSGTSGVVASATPSPLRAAGPMAFNYWEAFVGNVMGSNSISGWTYVCTGSAPTKCIWQSGWSGGEWGTNPDTNLNGSAHTWLFKHADYDYVNKSVNDYASGTPCGGGVACSHTLPNSFYLAAQPAYFGASGASCSYTWPWVTPQSAPTLQNPTGCTPGSTTASGSFTLGATSFSVASCSGFTFNLTVWDASLTTPAEIGKVKTCTSTTLALQIGSSSASHGAADSIQALYSGLPAAARWQAGTPFVQP